MVEVEGFRPGGEALEVEFGGPDKEDEVKTLLVEVEVSGLKVERLDVGFEAPADVSDFDDGFASLKLVSQPVIFAAILFRKSLDLATYSMANFRFFHSK